MTAIGGMYANTLGGAHRFCYGKPVTGTIWFFTPGLHGIGYLYDYWTLNDHITVVNASS